VNHFTNIMAPIVRLFPRALMRSGSEIAEARLLKRDLSPLEKQAADALRRARRLPIGSDRNDLRQLAIGLLWLHRHGMEALVKHRSVTIEAKQQES